MEVNGEMIQRWADEYSQELERERIEIADLLNHKEHEIKELSKRCKVVYSNFSKMIKDKSTCY